ncbi:hypothetical protein TCAL_14669 [Tigriopus californicus]|uniref:Uncharacterized protein n=1 Tax=Tigriopus californicus TaxID=6832 RepID=A0A553NR15_TIGCA|nr:hypothetical protein TCAL_14669 [Tigriopus californicus]
MSYTSLRSLNFPIRSLSNQTLTVSVVSKTGRRNITKNGPSFVPAKKKVNFARRNTFGQNMANSDFSTTSKMSSAALAQSKAESPNSILSKNAPIIEYNASKRQFQYHKPAGILPSTSGKRSILKSSSGHTEPVRFYQTSSIKPVSKSSSK